MDDASDASQPTGSLASRYARFVVAARYWIIAGWVAVALLTPQLPHLAEADAENFDAFVPQGSDAVQVEGRSIDAFGFPLVSRMVLVQHDPTGLSPYTQAEAVLSAVALTQGAYPDLPLLVGALPVTNTFAVFPSSSQRGTTALTYLFVRPDATLGRQTRAAREYAARHVSESEDALVGVTGSIPARVEQGRILRETLPLMERATLGVIILIVALNFRSLPAPAVALGSAGIAFLLAIRITGVGAQLLGVPVPRELEPVILALLLGVVTDYAIFFLAGMRRALQDGHDRLEAARIASATFGPIVGVAGITVAAGTAALLVAESAFFRAIGPAMALAVLIGLIVAVTLVPALMATFGRSLFWPATPRAATTDSLSGRRSAGAGIAAMTWRPSAAVLAVACLIGLVLAAAPLRDMRIGVGFVSSLPRTTEAQVAAAAASAGFAPGILSPSVLLVEQDGVAGQRAELTRLGNALARQPGVAGVVGPGDAPPELEQDVLLASSGNAARYLIVLDDEPLGAHGIATLDRLHDRLPALLDDVGLGDARAGFGGDTAVARELIGATEDDLGRIAVAALLVNLLLLIGFLRSLIAPLYLLVCSVLALAAALGLMTFVFQDLLGHDGVTFYVPFAAAVLLLSLGSDYNIFGVGHIWSKARRLPLGEAISEAVPETTRAITAAGITLAASFGMLALVPLRPFREMAFVMAVGIMLDAVVVRSVLVPTLLTLVGPVSGWPWARLARAGPTSSPEPAEPARHGGAP